MISAIQLNYFGQKEINVSKINEIINELNNVIESKYKLSDEAER